MVDALSADQLVTAAGGNMFARAAAGNGDIRAGVWGGDRAVLWGQTFRDALTIVGVGSPEGTAHALKAILPDLPDARWVSLPRGWLRHAPPGLVVPRHDWEWFWTTTAPAPIPVDGRPQWLNDDDYDDVRTLLSAAMPDASTWPGDNRSRRWAGIRHSSGRLVAVVADTSKGSAAAHISSVATDPDHRRNGYAAALTAWATAEFLRGGAEMVTLGMYAGNDGVRRLYQRLGFSSYALSAGELISG